MKDGDDLLKFIFGRKFKEVIGNVEFDVGRISLSYESYIHLNFLPIKQSTKD